MSNMPAMKATDMIGLLRKYRWNQTDQHGSHAQFTHPVLPGKVTVERHDGKTLPTETVRSILQHAGMDRFYKMLMKGSGYKIAERAIKAEAAEKFDAPAVSAPASTGPQLQPG